LSKRYKLFNYLLQGEFPMTVTAETVVSSAPLEMAPSKTEKVVGKAATQAAIKPAAPKVAKATVKPAAKAPKVVQKATPKVPQEVAPKEIAKAAPKPAPKVVTKVAPKAADVPAVSPKAEKLAKPKKAKLVRDSFTMPKTEYVVLDELKLRAIKLASPIKKTELIRAGIKALAAMSDKALLAALKAVPAIKTGRPAKS
jgi:hypothetical protein